MSDRELWLAVVHRAVEDANTYYEEPPETPTTQKQKWDRKSQKRVIDQDRKEALRWLLCADDEWDFKHVCGLADLDPDWVQDWAFTTYKETS